MAKFLLGEVIVTPRARSILSRAGLSPEELIERHSAGDWGEINDEQWGLNELALLEQFNLVSSYATSLGDAVTVFTKHDRSYTLMHLAPPAPQSTAERTAGAVFPVSGYRVAGDER